MKKIDYGLFAKLCYKGTLENGVVFDTTDKCKPLEIRVGDGSHIQGFENALIGMGLNERKSFVLEPGAAYGERDESLERSFDRADLDLRFEPFPGQVIVFLTDDGQEFPAVIKFVSEEVIVADFNHPLAGRQLAFEVEVADIREKQDDPSSPCVAECCCPA